MKKLMQLIFIILALTGFMLLVGSVGALELGNITIEQTIKQSIMSFGIFTFSVIGYKAVNWEDDSEMH